MRGHRRRVFVSSTVSISAILRSSVRWWLNENGYDPQLSEHSAFEKALDSDSYTACLKAVEDTDYFILIVGSRRGGRRGSTFAQRPRERHRGRRSLTQPSGERPQRCPDVNPG